MLRAFPTVPAFWKPEIADPSNCAESLIDVVAVVGEMDVPPKNVSLRSLIWLDAKAYGVACAVPPSPATRPSVETVAISRDRAALVSRCFISVGSMSVGSGSETTPAACKRHTSPQAPDYYGACASRPLWV